MDFLKTLGVLLAFLFMFPVVDWMTATLPGLFGFSLFVIFASIVIYSIYQIYKVRND